MLNIKKICFSNINSCVFIILLALTTGIAFFGLSCGEPTNQEAAQGPPSPKDFNDYWFQGLAEISRFDLEQARYGEIRRSDAVLIFVTEEFFTDRQVKSERGKQPDAVTVLKLNFIRKFNTGIYAYSIMSSIFTPLDRKSFPHTLKVTTSIQEWCGQTFTQLNFLKNNYHILLRSYYMDEGDRQYTLNPAQLEDEIWTLIRIDPRSLATGDIELIPGTQFSRLKHINQKVQKANASLVEENGRYIYAIDYKEIPRKLVIKFKKVFPYEIMEWEETSSRDRGSDQSILTTRAVRSHLMLVDYWNKRSVADSAYREELGLE